jgi:hypothetical protein
MRFSVCPFSRTGLHLKLGRDNLKARIRRLDIVLADLRSGERRDGRLVVDPDRRGQGDCGGGMTRWEKVHNEKSGPHKATDKRRV